MSICRSAGGPATPGPTEREGAGEGASRRPTVRQTGQGKGAETQARAPDRGGAGLEGGLGGGEGVRRRGGKERREGPGGSAGAELAVAAVAAGGCGAG